MTCRFAAIDLGTNSAKLSIAEVGESTRLTLIERDRVVLGLGRKVAANGRLGPEAIERTVGVIDGFVQRARALHVDGIALVATSACREAADSDVLVRMVRERSDVDLRIISGQEEAELTWESVRRRVGTVDQGMAMFDVGGGSTELVLHGGAFITSVGLGAVRLTERFGCSERLNDATRRLLVDCIDSALDDAVPTRGPMPERLLGTGGTATTLALLDTHGLPLPPRERRQVAGTDGYHVSIKVVTDLAGVLGAMSRDERIEHAGMGQTRSRIIVAGVTIVERVMRRLGVDAFEVHEHGLRDGLLMRMTEARD